MELSKAAEGDGTLRGVIDDDGMDESGGGFVHVPESVQRAVPFADEDAFFALVGIRGKYGDKDVASCDILLNDRPPGIAGPKASFVAPSEVASIFCISLSRLFKFFISYLS